MKQQDVFKKIGIILNELNEQYDYLKADTDKLNELELELFVANTQFLKDHADILRRLNSQILNERLQLPPAPAPIAKLPPKPIAREIPAAPVKPQPKPQPARQETVLEQKFFEPVVQALKPVADEKPVKPVEPPYKDAEAQKAAETEPVDDTIRHELVMDDDENWEDDEPELYDNDDVIEAEETDDIPGENTIELEPVVSAEPEIEPEPEPEPMVEEAPVAPEAPAAKDEVLTINQRMSAQISDKKIASLPPVTDLKSVINLNDKLLYVKDLFNGYSLAYSEAIEILNRFTTFEEAQRFLNNNYVTKNNWEEKAATAEKFYDLLKRRYA